jgi:hypothetical protein
MMVTAFNRNTPTQCAYCHAMAMRRDIAREEIKAAALELRAPDWVHIAMCEEHARTAAADILAALTTLGK